jgi:hypothetical protein
MTARHSSRSSESGNVIVFILMAVVLIGIVTVAIRSGGGERANIDAETLIIRAAETRQHASEFERAVAFLLQSGVSESAVRFAHADAPSDYGNINVDPQNQVFSRNGGGAAYRAPPPGVQGTAATWEFYGNTALPQVGSNRAELIAVLPNVTEAFCTEINKGSNNSQPIPDDDATCIHTGAAVRFSSSNLFNDSTPNTLNGTFANLPATQGCVRCTGSGTYQFFHTLLAR